MANQFIPPGGFLGASQLSVADQTLLRKKAPRRKKRKTSSARTAGAPSRRKVTRKKATRKKAAPKRRTTGRLKKGSPAAKRRMAELRAMQKRNR